MSKKELNSDINELMKRINKFSNVNKEYEYLNTGIDVLDNFFAGFSDVQRGRGGMLRGKMYSFSGGAGVGKTTLLLDICKRFCENKYNVLYIDVEDGINDRLESVDLLKYYTNDIQDYGKDQNNRFFVVSPQTYGECIDVIKDILKIVKVDFIVIDSIKHLLTSTDIDSNSEDIEGMLLDKRIEGVFFPILKNIARKYNLTICFIQQVRVKKKGMFFVVDESGGNAFLHSVDSRLFLKQKETIEVDKINNEGIKIRKEVGNIVEIVTKKSRFGMFNLTLPIVFGKGISLVYYYYRILKNIGYIQNKASIYSINVGDLDVKVKGENEVYKVIKDNFEKIEDFLYKNNLIVIEKDKEEEDGV